MKFPCLFWHSRWAVQGIALTILLSVFLPREVRAGIDENNNGFDDIWELFYNATNLSLSGDEDGDGRTNLAECQAGTDPFDNKSSLRFTVAAIAGSEITLTWPSVDAKIYWAESTTDLQNWDEDNIEHYGTGEDLSLKLSDVENSMLIGAVNREVWLDIPGQNVSALTSHPNYPASSNGVHSIARLECPENDGDDFGVRIQGYLIAPGTGKYTFTLQSKDGSALYLSTDDDPANKELVASISGNVVGVLPHVPVNEVQGEGVVGNGAGGNANVDDAIIAPLPGTGSRNLVAGQVYYIEVLHKAGKGNDHCRVLWQGPRIPNRTIIDGQHLASWLGTAGIPGTGPRRFYRIDVGDRDTDNDGATDWEERMTFANRFDTDSLVTGVDDGVTLTNAINAATNTIDASVADGNGYEEGANSNPNDASVTLTRSGQLTPVTVFYTTSGKANVGEDFVALSGFATFPFGVNSVDVDITPVADTHLEVPEDLIVTIDDTPVEYQVGASGAATVMIEDYEVQTERLYVANLSAENGAQTVATGISTLFLSGDHTGCRISLSFQSLTSSQTAAHVHEDGGGAIIESLPMGQFSNHMWDFPPTGQGIYTSDQAILDALQNGEFYVNVHSAVYTPGEIRGDYVETQGSIEFDPPDDPGPPPIYSGEEAEKDTVRFLSQATFGATDALVQEVLNTGIDAWIDEQIDLNQTPMSGLLSYTYAGDGLENANNAALGAANHPDYDPNFEPRHHNRRRGWWAHTINGTDQLRQRVAFALSEILVTSEENSTVRYRHYGHADFYDLLASSAFGNFRTLLEDVTKHPIMATYLSMLKNEKANGITSPDENYAREVMQLFSIGLLELHPDGTLKLSAQTGLPISTYTNNDITELAKVLTGWSFAVKDDGSNNTNFYYGGGTRYALPTWTTPLKMFQTKHETSGKTIVTGHVIQPNQPGETDLSEAMDVLFNHPNTGPFICRRLIQRLVTSNPTRGYVYRVANVFADNGSGVRGDLGAVVKAILTDYEARAFDAINTSYGKQREPIIQYLNLLRAFGSTTQLRVSDLDAHGYVNNLPSTSWRYRFYQTDNNISQTPQTAPSVFNWFMPDYTAPGKIASSAMVAPEFQTTSETTVVSITNFKYNVIFGSNGQNVQSWPGDDGNNYLSDNVILDRSTAESILTNQGTDELIDYFDMLLLAGSMSPEMRTSMQTLINTTTGGVTNQVRAALYIVINSPEFNIQR